MDKLVELATTHAEFVFRLEQARKDLRNLEREVKKSEDALISAFSDAGLESVTIHGGLALWVETRYSYSILPDNKAGAFFWLRNVGLGALIQETVHSGSLSAAMRKRAERQKQISPLIECKDTPFVKVAKSRKKHATR